MKQGSGKNRVFGLKVMRVYWQNLIEFLQGVTDLSEYQENEILHQCFPNLRYIWIIRCDKVRQAISWVKFIQGAAWYWEDEHPQRLDNLVFKPDVIREFIIQTVRHETAWQEYFRKNEIQPCIVVYEDFVIEYEKTARQILEYIGIHHHDKVVFGERRLKKQADTLTDEWVQRYLELYKDTERM